MSAVLSCPECRAAWQKVRELPSIAQRPPGERGRLIESYFADFHRLGHDAQAVIDEARAREREIERKADWLAARIGP